MKTVLGQQIVIKSMIVAWVRIFRNNQKSHCRPVKSLRFCTVWRLARSVITEQVPKVEKKTGRVKRHIQYNRNGMF
ncbi:hypothetical protein pipiens_007315 [Culex pipiens pipiens]|uniref:Secreted protein n=1 Tax=Culex pipiens pipiens TaxID=38569 RepID=A0ABD1DM05_CULPP